MTERIGLEAYFGTSLWDPAVARFMGDQQRISNALLKTVLGTTALTAGVIALASQGAKVEGLRDNFEKLGGSLTEWRAATKDMMSDVAIFKAFNDAALDLSSTLAMRLPEAMDFLQRKAYATGQSVDTMVGQLVRAVEYGMPRSFRQLGLDLIPQKIYEETARQLRTTVDDLTMDQKQTALFNAALVEMRANLGGLVDPANRAQGNILKLETTMANMRAELGDALLPILVEMIPHIEKMGKALTKMFADPRFRDAVKDFAELLSQILELTTAWIANNAWSIKATAGLYAFVTVVKGAVAVYEFASAIHFLNSQILETVLTSTAGSTAIAALLNTLRWAPVAWAGAQQGATNPNILAEQQAKHRQQLAAEEQQIRSSTVSYGAYIAQLEKIMPLEVWNYYYLVKSEKEYYGAAQAVDNMTRAMRDYGYAARHFDIGGPATTAPPAAAPPAPFVMPMMYQVGPLTEAIRSTGEDTLAIYAEIYQSIEVLAQTHEQNMFSIQENYAQSRTDALFNYQMQTVEAELDYQGRRAAMVARGRDDMVKEFDRAHAVETANMERQYKMQEGLAQRSMYAQQVIEAKGNVDRITQQIKAYEQEIGNILLQDKNFLMLNIIQQAILLERLGIHNVMMLIGQAQGAKAMLLQEQGFGEALIATDEAIWAARMAALNGQLADATAGYNAALNKFNTFSAGLIGQITPPAFDPTQYNAPVQAVQEATKSATKTMAEVAKDIRNAVEDAEDAIMHLATFTIPAGTKKGLENLSEYLIMAAKAMYYAYTELNKKVGGERVVKLGSLQEGMEHINAIVGVIKPAIDTMVALSEYEAVADLPERMDILSEDMLYAVLRLNDVYQILNQKIEGVRLVKLGSLEEGAGHVGTIIGIIKPTIDAMQALADYKTGNLVEIMDVFEADFLYVISRIAELADKISDVGVLKARLFQANAEIINGAIQSGIAAIQDTATAMINLETGGAVQMVFNPLAGNAAFASMANQNVTNITLQFGDVTVSEESDWARLKALVTEAVAEAV